MSADDLIKQLKLYFRDSGSPHADIAVPTTDKWSDWQDRVIFELVTVANKPKDIVNQRKSMLGSFQSAVRRLDLLAGRSESLTPAERSQFDVLKRQLLRETERIILFNAAYHVYFELPGNEKKKDVNALRDNSAFFAEYLKEDFERCSKLQVHGEREDAAPKPASSRTTRSSGAAPSIAVSVSDLEAIEKRRIDSINKTADVLASTPKSATPPLSSSSDGEEERRNEAAEEAEQERLRQQEELDERERLRRAEGERAAAEAAAANTAAFDERLRKEREKERDQIRKECEELEGANQELYDNSLDEQRREFEEYLAQKRKEHNFEDSAFVAEHETHQEVTDHLLSKDANMSSTVTVESETVETSASAATEAAGGGDPSRNSQSQARNSGNVTGNVNT